MANANLAGWSRTAASVGLAGFLAFTGHTGWAIFFVLLALALGVVGSK